ncbi:MULTISPECIES: peptidoglycan recognition protein family protein [Bacillaceae]|uniref:peptidoglycan recognition protein family protein n=1 Tax=Bacillaceae TaxID=186817 RepID=UPI002FFF8B0E
MNIIQRFIPASNTDTRPGIKMVPKYITIHETDNPNPGADAEAHARLQERGNDRSASWHLQIDDHEAIQSIPFNEVAWAAGDGRSGTGNTSSIHIEICVNSDGDFKKAVANAAEVTNQLMKTYHIPIANVVQHNHWSGKNCPIYLRNGGKAMDWYDFIQLVGSGINHKHTQKSVSFPGHLILRGSTGKDVELIQRVVHITVDGIFGPKTEAAVRAYQKFHGLIVDGIVGSKTWGVMF